MNVNNWRIKRDPSDLPPREQTPNSPFQQRKNNQPLEQRLGRSSNLGPPRDTIRKPYSDQRAELAIEEGRRLYVGNMPYEATVKDVESLFKDIAHGVESINMSVDPMTGRNPSYCFVDFTSKALAEQVMAAYNGRDFLRRPIKVKPGIKSGTGSGRYDVRPKHRPEETQQPFDRWRRWETPEQLGDAGQEGRRLYVGGLPRFKTQEETTSQIRDLFKSGGFSVEVISKLVSAHESKKDEPGNHNFCFVDLASSSLADQALQALNGLEMWGWQLKVNKARGASVKLAERRRLYVGGLPDFAGPLATEAGIKELFQGYQIQVVSKLFPPKEDRKDEEGNHHYCFVELSDEQQTDAAIEALDWKEMWGWKVRVKPALGNSKQTTRPETRQWGQSR